MQACLENQYGANSWEVRVVDTSDADLLEILNTEVEFSVSGVNCLQVLDKVYETWNKLGWAYTIENGKNILTIGAPNDRTAANTTEGYSFGAISYCTVTSWPFWAVVGVIVRLTVISGFTSGPV